MVAVVAAAGDGRRRSRWGPGLHPLCGPCTRWVWRHGWCSNCAEHWHAPALISRDARGPSTTLIHHLGVELRPEKRAFILQAIGTLWMRHGEEGGREGQHDRMVKI